MSEQHQSEQQTNTTKTETDKARPRYPDNDVIFIIKNPHRPGMLGKVTTVIGEEGGLIGDMKTLFVGHDHVLREIVVSVFDAVHLGQIERCIKERSEAEVIEIKDIVFEHHRNGKLHMKRTREVDSVATLRYVYTPGVARVCKAIQQDPDLAREYTSVGNNVGIFTNGTRVLGLGDIGPLASLPVMEGKAMLYDQFVGISAIPILIDTKDPDEFINIVEKLSIGFAGIHLEDIRTPDCFMIEDELIKRLNKPVMHDDQHGTATVLLAALINALKQANIENHRSVTVAQLGLGAAGFAIAKLLIDYGFNVMAFDPNPSSHERLISAGGTVADFDTAMKADVVIATTGRVGLITKEMIKKGQIILALSNPIPEILPEDAIEAGAAFAADGKSVNNALAYPGLFKAAIEMRAEQITSEMKIAAALAIAEHAEPNELVPSPFNHAVHQAVIDRVKALVSLPNE